MVSRYCVGRLRWIVPGLLAVLGAGCSDALLTPPGVPTGAALVSYYEDDFAAAQNSGIDPQSFLISGISFVDQQCMAFFDSVEQMNRKLKVGQSTFLTAGNQVQTLMTLAEKSALSIAKVAAAVEITKVLLEQYQAEFAFAPHSVELRAIILQAMHKERTALEQILLSRSQDLSHHEAVYAVKRYATNCTLSNISEQWNRAIAKAVVDGVGDAATVGQNGSDAEGIDYESTGSRSRSVLSVPRYVVR